jgi:hypothetical protein
MARYQTTAGAQLRTLAYRYPSALLSNTLHEVEYRKCAEIIQCKAIAYDC